MVFLLLVAVQILIFLQGASAGRLYINLQHRHPAHGLHQGVLASCTPANGARCRVSLYTVCFVAAFYVFFFSSRIATLIIMFLSLAALMGAFLRTKQI